MSTGHDREQSGPAGEDPALVRAWRAASDEQPPARLDAAILDAARRSPAAEEKGSTTRRVEQRTRNRWMQWQPLAAAATVAGLAFVLLQTLPREREVAPPIRMQVPESAPSPAQEVVPPNRGGAPVPAPAPAVSRESQGSALAPVPTEAPAGADAAQPRRERGATGATVEAYSQEAAAPAAGRSAIPAPSPPAERSAGDWVSRIEALHTSGDLDGAAAALHAFRAVDPDADARLPESLRAWARTVE